MNKVPRRVSKVALKSVSEDRRSSRADTEEGVRNLLSTSRFRAHDADSTRGCLGAPMRYGVFSLEEPDGER